MRKTGILVVFGVALIMLSVPFVSAEQVHIQYKLPDNLSSIPSWMKVYSYANDSINQFHKIYFPQYGWKTTASNRLVIGEGSTFIVDTNKTFSKNITYINMWLNISGEHKHPALPLYDATYDKQYQQSITIKWFNFANKTQNPNTIQSSFFEDFYTYNGVYNVKIEQYNIFSIYYGKGYEYYMSNSYAVIKKFPNMTSNQFFYMLKHNSTVYFNLKTHIQYIKNAINSEFIIDESVNLQMYYNGGVMKINYIYPEKVLPTTNNYKHLVIEGYGRFYNIYGKGVNATNPERYYQIDDFSLDISQKQLLDIVNPQGNATGNYPLTYNIGLILGISIITMVIATDIYIHKKFP